MTPLLQLHHLSKSYKKQVAIDDISLALPAGKIIGSLVQMGVEKQL